MPVHLQNFRIVDAALFAARGLYRETEGTPAGSVELVIETVRDGGPDATAFEGTYRLTVQAIEAPCSAILEPTSANGIWPFMLTTWVDQRQCR